MGGQKDDRHIGVDLVFLQPQPQGYRNPIIALQPIIEQDGIEGSSLEMLPGGFAIGGLQHIGTAKPLEQLHDQAADRGNVLDHKDGQTFKRCTRH